MRQSMIFFITIVAAVLCGGNAAGQNFKNFNSGITKSRNAESAKPANDKQGSEASQGVEWTTFYPTAAWYGNDGFAVLGHGLEDRPIKIRISGDLLYMSGHRTPYMNEYNFKKTLKREDGVTAYLYNGPWGFQAYVYVNEGLDGLTIGHFGDGIILSMTYYYSSRATSERVAEQNKGQVRQGGAWPNMAQNAPSSSSSSGDNELNLRYPEYSKYNDSRGNFSDSKYKEVRRSECTRCNHTGVSLAPENEGMANYTGYTSWLAYSNSEGNKCPYCGKHSRHFHSKCGICNIPSY